MKNLVRLGIAGALALSGSMAAHASMTPGSLGSTSTPGSTGDLILFADVYNSSGAFLGAYVGDTGVSAGTSGSTVGTTTSAFDDSNLKSLLSLASGNTIMWAIEAAGGNGAGNGTAGPSPYVVSTGNATNGSQFSNLKGIQLGQMANAWDSQVGTLSGQAASGSNSVLLPTGNPLTAGGTGFNPTGTTPDASDWYNNSGFVATNGLGSASLYLMTATDTGTTTRDVTTLLSGYTVSLTSSGFTITSSTVPLPAAVWLLGSGLLGLAGIARRKVGAA